MELRISRSIIHMFNRDMAPTKERPGFCHYSGMSRWYSLEGWWEAERLCEGNGGGGCNERRKQGRKKSKTRKSKTQRRESKTREERRGRNMIWTNTWTAGGVWTSRCMISIVLKIPNVRLFRSGPSTYLASLRFFFFFCRNRIYAIKC